MSGPATDAAPAVSVGDVAPDFTLRTQNNEEFTLSSYRGEKAVLVVFYPLAFTGICTNELGALRDGLDTFQNEGVQAVTISCDATPSLKIFAMREGFEFPLLSDYWPHGAVAQRYGVFNDKSGFANRGTFLVDREGVVRFAEMSSVGEGRDPQRWRDAIAALD